MVLSRLRSLLLVFILPACGRSHKGENIPQTEVSSPSAYYSLHKAEIESLRATNRKTVAKYATLLPLDTYLEAKGQNGSQCYYTDYSFRIKRVSNEQIKINLKLGFTFDSSFDEVSKKSAISKISACVPEIQKTW